MSDPDPPAAETKSALRARLRAARSALSEEQQQAAAQAVVRRLVGVLGPGQGRVLGLYAAVRGELPVETAWLAGHVLGASFHDSTSWRLAWPVPEPTGTMTFRVWPERPSTPGPWGIPVPPASAPTVRPDAVVVPGVAFDRVGHRLGSGAGFYDRFFDGSWNLTPRIGVCVHLALQDRLPCDPWDKRMTHVVTERELLLFP